MSHHPPTHSPSAELALHDPHGGQEAQGAHGAHGDGHDHGHTILGFGTLAGVLALLMFFTLLTVGLSRAEVAVADYLQIEIPQWVNVAIALTIATIKGALVAMFFMQLRYDNPINTMILLFCLFAFALFLFFSMMDLGARNVVYDFKSGEVKRGGQGIDATYEVHEYDPIKGEYKYDRDGQPVMVKAGVNTGGDPIYLWARKQRMLAIETDVKAAFERVLKGQAIVHGSAVDSTLDHVIADMTKSGELADLELQKDLVIKKTTEKVFKSEYDAAHGHGGHGHDDHGPASTSQQSRPARGLTPGLLTEPGHGGDHGAGHTQSHGGGKPSGGH
jgi:cytochrome c oxidase subunit IV